jgi:hypothetical protein
MTTLKPSVRPETQDAVTFQDKGKKKMKALEDRSFSIMGLWLCWRDIQRKPHTAHVRQTFNAGHLRATLQSRKWGPPVVSMGLC